MSRRASAPALPYGAAQPQPPAAPSPVPTPKRPDLPRYKSHIVEDKWYSWYSRSIFKRQSYSASQIRRYALMALGAASLIATGLLLHAWLISMLGPMKVDQFAADHHFASEHEVVAKPVLHDAVPPVEHVHADVEKRHAHQQQPLQQRRKHHRIGAATSRIVEPPAFAFSAPAQELGALVSFMVALASNSLPIGIDANKPLKADLVLEINPRDPNAAEDVNTIIQEVWTSNPVVVFSDLVRGDPPASREVKAMIETFKLYPDPAIFEVDQRADEVVLRPLLQRLTGIEHTPLVIIGGSPIRTMEELRAMRDSGRLKELIEAAGAKINGRKVKKGRKH